MNNSNNKKRWLTLFVAAVVCGFVSAGIIEATCKYILSHGAENGEQSWQTTFIFLQAMLPYLLFHVAGLDDTKISSQIFTGISALINGTAVALILFVFGSILLTCRSLWQKGGHENKN